MWRGVAVPRGFPRRRSRSSDNTTPVPRAATPTDNNQDARPSAVSPRVIEDVIETANAATAISASVAHIAAGFVRMTGS